MSDHKTLWDIISKGETILISLKYIGENPQKRQAETINNVPDFFKL